MSAPASSSSLLPAGTVTVTPVPPTDASSSSSSSTLPSSASLFPPTSTSTSTSTDHLLPVTSPSLLLQRSSSKRTPLSPPLCNFVDAMLTESSGLLMCYAHWMNRHQNDSAVFDLFFRQHPFHGEFTIFAGLEEVLRFLQTYAFSDEDILVLKKKFSSMHPDFFLWLRKTDMSEIKVYAIPEGTIVHPRIPLMRVEGPLGLCQLLESTLVVLVNFASLIATNAARHRIAVGPTKTLLEFGLRRAQGPDGAMSASRYAYLGGFDGTSNVKAASVFGIEMRGTHAHSFVTSFYSMNDIKNKTLKTKDGVEQNFVSTVLQYRSELKKVHTHEGELAAFISYAQAFPNGFLGLLDTFDTLESGVWNYICVALALHEYGYKPIGIRLDSGDLAYLSREVRKIFVRIADQYKIDYFAKMTIVASNDLSERVLYALKEQGHEIDTFGIGTNLVTCKSQPALGCVFRLVELNKIARIKVSSDVDKVTIPGSKEAYRLYNSTGEPVLDLLIQCNTSVPQPGKRILCRHPFDANKRVYVTPARVELLHQLFWDGSLHSRGGVNVLETYPSLTEVRERVKTQLASLREDHLRRLNPTPYKASVSSDLFSFMADLWLQETPIAEIM